MADIGAMLREARMREHLDIAEFEARTKIRAKYLRALEDEEWGQLPGYTFTKAFLRTYADMLGLDGRMVVDEFKRQFPDPQELELAPVQPPRRDARRSRERGGERRGRQAGPSGRVLAVALLIVLIAAAVFVVHELRKKSKTPPPARPPAHSTTTQPHKHSPKVATPKRVGVQIAALTPVDVCLVGYAHASGGRHQRLPTQGAATPTQSLVPGAARPVYHDNHFLVSFTDGTAHLIVNLHTVVDVNAVGTTVSYSVSLRGHHRLLPSSQAPRCT
jgi:cytoskeletal protein RodZ